MTTANNDALNKRLQGLRKTFAAQLPGKIHELKEAWGGLSRDGWNAGGVEALTQLLHTLAGTAGTFGFSAIRTAARGMEAELRAFQKSETIPGSVAMEKLGKFLIAISEANIDVPVPGKSSYVREEAPSAPQGNTIFFVEDDSLVSDFLAIQIRYYGYAVTVFTTLYGLMEAMKTTVPQLIIMDLSFPEGGLAGADAIAQIQNAREPKIPVVFLSSRGDFDARLEAVRSGGDAYFVKPVDVSKLVDRLDVLTKRRPPAPYRILIVDDEPLLAEYHAMLLQQAGMMTAMVTDPSQAVQSMTDFRPELVLMDVYMPVCNGMELARIIRQDETYIDIPIVFLSSETDIDRQLAAMSRGGDDFLTKPIQPAHLIASVTLRADRYRTLRSLMLYDGLTGLLNHTKTKERLDIEVARAARQKANLSFAMIDIDRFKSVNDTHGHPVGDQVIKSLSSLLKQRLRITDTVGRFGGEEFAIVLADTDGQTALNLLNELREDFGKILHSGRDGVFSATFSCGVACPAPGSTGAALIDKADKALYAAKDSGRNRVVLEGANEAAGEP